MQLDSVPRAAIPPIGTPRSAFRRLRRPAPKPNLVARGGWSNYLARLSWLFS